MSFENPLDRIKKMNAENEVKKSQEEALEKKQEIQSQENTDTQYELVSDQKQTYSEQVIQFKERIADITGTQEEMIAEYRKTINEAKKDPETLKYVRDNFDEIFAGAKKQWNEIGSEKIGAIESKNDFEESITGLDSQLEELHPQTTEGKKEFEEEKEILNKELEKSQLELNHLEARKQHLLDDIKSAESFIENKKREKETYSNTGILGQEIETDFAGGGRSLKIISDDAKKYSELWNKLKVFPNIIGTQPDLPEKLKKYGYTSEEFKEKELEIKKVQDKIRDSMKGHQDFFTGEGITGPSFPRINMNLAPGIDIFKGSIGELIDKNITLKKDLLSSMNEKLEALNKQIEIVQQEIKAMEEK